MTDPRPLAAVQPSGALNTRRRRARAQEFARRMADFADLLMLPKENAAEFNSIMLEIAQDFAAGPVQEAQFYDHIRHATDQLPMTKAQALHFAGQVRRHLENTAAEDD